MNLQEAAKKLHTAFLSRMGVKLETVKTKDGAELEIEGDSVFIVSSEGERIAAPDGEYELEGGRSIEVKDGRIVEIEKETEEAPEEVEAKEESKSIDMTKEEVEAMIDEKMTALKEELKSELMMPKEEEATAEEEVEASKEEVEVEASKEEVELASEKEEEAAPLKGAPIQEEVALSAEKEDLSGMSYEERIFAQISKFSK